MNIHYTNRHHGPVSDALRNYAEAKLTQLKKYHSKISSVHVIFNVEKNLQIVEATMHIPHHQVHASHKAGDMYSAVDLMVDSLKQQLKKHKEKMVEHR